MPEKVLDLLDNMAIEPDEVNLAIIYNACANLSTDRAKKIGNELVERMPKTYQSCSYVMNSAIHMFMNFGDVQSAENLFQQVRKKDMITFGAMMKGKVFEYVILM